MSENPCQRYEVFSEVVDGLAVAVRRAVDTRETTGCDLNCLLRQALYEVAFEHGGASALMAEAGWETDDLMAVVAAVDHAA